MKTIVGYGLLLFFAAVAAGNARLIYRGLILHMPSSLVPVIGGVLGSVGCFVLGETSFRSWWYVPLFVDVGCIPLLLYTGCFFAFNPVEETKPAESDGETER